MENKDWGKRLREKKILQVQTGDGQQLQMEVFSYEEARPQANGIYLLYEIFQLRSIALPFEEVAIDLIGWTERPVVFSTYPSKLLENATNSDALIKFVLIKESFWKDFLFNSGQIVLCQSGNKELHEFITDKPFPWTTPKATEMFIGPDGEVKIWNE